MGAGVRKLTLTAHVICAVGWLGAVITSLALGVATLTSPEDQTVRAAYLMLEFTGWFVLIPLSIGSLLTGVVQALGTAWGLFRHHWVVFKLLINVLATTVLLLYMQTLGYLAGLARSPIADLNELRTPTAVIHAGGALLLLLVAVTLSVHKPRGMTRYGQRTQRAQQSRHREHRSAPMAQP